MSWLLWFTAALVSLLIVVLAIGYSLPETVSVTRSRMIAAPPERVFALVTDVAGQTAWRRDVRSVELGSDGKSWTEKTRDGATIRFQETVREVPGRFAVSFTSDRGFGGAWDGRFEADGAGTRITMTERVTIPNPVFRLMARVLRITERFMDDYLDALTRAAAGP